MARKIWTVAKLHLKNINTAYMATATITIMFASQYVINAVVAAITGEDLSTNIGLSSGWTLWLLPTLAAVLISTRNLTRIVNLGGKRANYFWGSLAAYAVLACAVSLIGLLIFYTLDRPMVGVGRYGDIATVPEVFCWDLHGPIVAFLQQAAFLFLFASFTHTLSAMQGKWYGWITNLVLVAVISTFTPIEPLRNVEVWFFNMILFHTNASLQIATCITLAVVIYMLNKPILARRAV